MVSVIELGLAACGQIQRWDEERPSGRIVKRTRRNLACLGADRRKEHLAMLARRVDDDGGKLRKLSELLRFDDWLIDRPV
jgi:hypothetical protein